MTTIISLGRFRGTKEPVMTEPTIKDCSTCRHWRPGRRKVETPDYLDMLSDDVRETTQDWLRSEREVAMGERVCGQVLDQHPELEALLGDIEATGPDWAGDLTVEVFAPYTHPAANVDCKAWKASE